MPHDTTAENCNTRSNTAETAEISSHWKSAEIADFPSRWKFGPYGQKNGGGIVVITAAALSAPGLCRFMQGNEKPEPVAHGKQIRISRFWYG